MKTSLEYKAKEEGKKYILNLENSLIINKEEIKKIEEWINSNGKKKEELLYRLSRDGDQISKFHQLCDNKGKTLTLFQIEDGNKCGIYTALFWDNNSSWKNGMEAFIFNLNKNEKYKKTKNAHSILCDNNHGPWTHSLDLIKLIK